ncbi:FAD binding domain-containing protein [Aspergillus alliaceus]|uniref:FAD binding domain-containing protein n=1 Tax=Petromyces alliaceus TaxID=209559 RepID=UPI0012A6E32F|nr:FAD binding domain-containing protein [Aspergillus alliaceus]KAB8238716.1 FAD binding domain-containing protein [Aspergillus alliaceus]
MTCEVQTKFLVVGAGPAGLALASFLGQNGLNGLVIAKAATTADTPRAHIFNPFAFECLRDIGIEDQGLQHAVRGRTLQAMRWARSMAGEEYGKVLGFSEHPSCIGHTHGITPSEYAELSQSELEPILLRYASHHSFHVRFSTELVDVAQFTDDTGKHEYICTIQDLISHGTWKIRTQYLFGADGARSNIARSLDFKFISKPSSGKACNVLLRADLAHLMSKERHAALHWILKPDRTTFRGMVGHLRMVRPWNLWVMVAFGPHGTNPFEGFTAERPELVDAVRDLIGDDSADIEILRVDSWAVRESVAEQYSLGGQNAFLLGDAAHRHPPAYGLGSNTCVQDAYNLAWKVAYVSKGLAGPRLLEPYTKERQPVGAMLATREAFSGNTGGGGLSRKSAQRHGACRGGAAELGCGLQSMAGAGRNPIVDVEISTYPGSRLPHAWLDIPIRGKMISTQDLAGKGAFCLLIGIGGDAWRQAATTITCATGIPINVYGIGYGLEYRDVHRDWHAARGVEETGCVLIRPDRFVAWRSTKLVPDCEGKLFHVLNTILSRDEL